MDGLWDLEGNLVVGCEHALDKVCFHRLNDLLKAGCVIFLQFLRNKLLKWEFSKELLMDVDYSYIYDHCLRPKLWPITNDLYLPMIILNKVPRIFRTTFSALCWPLMPNRNSFDWLSNATTKQDRKESSKAHLTFAPPAFVCWSPVRRNSGRPKWLSAKVLGLTSLRKKNSYWIFRLRF